MYNPIANTLNRLNYIKKDKLNILCWCTHESYATTLSNLDHNFYMLTGQNMKNWDYHTKPIPKNHFLCSPNTFPLGIQFDLIFSQSRFGQLQQALDISNKLDLPVIHVDHTEVLPNLSKSQVKTLKSLKAHKHVFITEHNQKSWEGDDNSIVIKHGIDTDKFNNWNGNNNIGISVVNQFASRDIFCGWELFKQIASSLPIELVGENPGISKSASSTDELIMKLARSRFFLNTSLLSPIPLSLLEAMSVGCPILSTAKQEVAKVLKHGYNALIYETPEEAIMYGNKLLKDIEFATYIGKNARQTILEKYTLNNFLDNWNKVFYETVENYK